MPFTDSSFDRRRIIAGTAGLGLAALAGVTFTQAQATPSADDPDTSDTRADDTRTARATERYDEFVAGLAGALSIGSTATVDAAIRTSLTGIVDTHLAAGEISANDADAARTAIASSPAPLIGLAMAGRDGGFRRGADGPELVGRHNDRRRNDGPETDSDQTDGSTDPGASASPSNGLNAATPAAAV